MVQKWVRPKKRRQCGADALFKDPHRSLCITQNAYLTAIALIKRHARPMLVLGGGGYNGTASAKLWASITAKLSGVRLIDDVPLSNEKWPK